jgi:hypothetical protein
VPKTTSWGVRTYRSSARFAIWSVLVPRGLEGLPAMRTLVVMAVIVFLVSLGLWVVRSLVWL